MNTGSNSPVEPSVSKMLDPYSNPRTIPGGWDVSAFFEQENENVLPSEDASDKTKPVEALTGKNDPTKNTL